MSTNPLARHSYPDLKPRAAVGHMPFEGHRDQRQVREEEARSAILRSLGRDPATGSPIDA